jgi:GTP-binding protein
MRTFAPAKTINMLVQQKIRNIAIIAHVDHGKTTLVDKIIYQSNVLRDNQVQNDLILDSNDLERERGITIFSKNISVQYNGYKINVIDTPGHADFGGEVERVLQMADGVLLLVDAFEGPMPQTRFVLQKALELGLKPIVVINKVDKPNCRPDETHEAVFDLFFNLDATEAQLDFPTVYGSSKHGWMSTDWNKPTDNLTALLDLIIEHVPPPSVNEGTTQLQITSIDYSNFTGRIAIGKLTRGTLREGMPVKLARADGTIAPSKIKELFVFEGLGRRKVTEINLGDLCAVVGIENFQIGDTIADFDAPEALPAIKVDEPTMNMLFTINDSPFFGKEGKFVTSQRIKERLYKETEKNLALKVEDGATTDSFMVYGRGILHLSILIETMRREGYELQIGQPQVLTRMVDGKKHEPYENLVIDTPEVFAGKLIEQVTMRKGDLLAVEAKGDRQQLQFEIPSRGLMGLRNLTLTLSQGEAIMAHRFIEYKPWKGDIPSRINGSLISMDTGTATPYSVDKLQDRGLFFINSTDEVYEGEVVGENNRAGDLVLNITKAKQLTNFRAAGSDDNAKIAPPRLFSLEEAMEYIQGDEYVEITPKSIRMRKIFLKEHERKRNPNKG